MTKIVFATSTAVLAHGGRRIPTQAGEAWDADDPIVAQHPHMFTPEPRAVRVTTNEQGLAEVEQATATPGEKRATRRRPTDG